MEMNTFLNSLQTVKINQCLIKKENLLEFEKNIKIIKIKANNIKNTIDNIVNDIENNVCFVFYSRILRATLRRE